MRVKNRIVEYDVLIWDYQEMDIHRNIAKMDAFVVPVRKSLFVFDLGGFLYFNNNGMLRKVNNKDYIITDGATYRVLTPEEAKMVLDI
jgi:predicted RecB family nuclease